MLGKAGSSELVEELTTDGIGAEFNRAFKNGKKVDAGEFMRWQFTETYGNRVVDFLEKKFKEFEILEHYGSSWKLRVSRDSFSIGFLFGLMEDI